MFSSNGACDVNTTECNVTKKFRQTAHMYNRLIAQLDEKKKYNLSQTQCELKQKIISTSQKYPCFAALYLIPVDVLATEQ